MSLRGELRAFSAAARSLDRQAAVVLVLAAVLAVLQYALGDRDVYHALFGGRLAPEWDGLLSWGWWFVVQGVLGFVIPVLVLTLGFRQRPSEIGLGAGDVRFAGLLALLYLPLVALGTWVLSARPDFQTEYPHYSPAAQNWALFWAFEALFLFYWIGWEYLWRGFVLFGTARALGLYAILVQAVPFAAMHAQKPWPEALLSVVGGVALGALCWRTRSFWIAVPIHSAQMLLLDLFCTLRVRSGVNGLGPGALVEILRKTGG
ncbi:MAG TPA: CPBP family intramembrane glutamic endopeptidase [Rhodothermales bacterium]|nr:CPBP family intramembrane glutamic endopeptidase [Rhodothermales bacterium]